MPLLNNLLNTRSNNLLNHPSNIPFEQPVEHCVEQKSNRRCRHAGTKLSHEAVPTTPLLRPTGTPLRRKDEDNWKICGAWRSARG
jgi:hypothetical protein